jgi:hypothetical protein
MGVTARSFLGPGEPNEQVFVVFLVSVAPRMPGGEGDEAFGVVK